MKRISRVYLNGVLDHTPDTEGAIREVHRVLRPGGVAKVMLYHRSSLNYWVEIVLRRGVLGAEVFAWPGSTTKKNRMERDHYGH